MFNTHAHVLSHIFDGYFVVYDLNICPGQGCHIFYFMFQCAYFQRY